MIGKVQLYSERQPKEKLAIQTKFKAPGVYLVEVAIANFKLWLRASLISLSTPIRSEIKPADIMLIKISVFLL